MAKVERRHRREEAGSPRGPHSTRVIAIGCAALVLMGGAYQAALGQGTQPTYEGGGGGISAAETAAIAVGAVAGIAALTGAAGGAGLLGFGKSGCPSGELMPNGDARILPPLPAGADVSELCLAPENTKVDAGMCRVFDLRGRSKSDKHWYSLTGNSAASIEVRDLLPNTPVVRLEGSKTTFCVPINATQGYDGRSVVIRGYWRPAGAPRPRFADARILVRIPGRSVPPAAPPEENQPRVNEQPELSR